MGDRSSRRIRWGVLLGLVLGGAGGAVLGAAERGWTGGLIGAYGGILCGMCVIGGVAGTTSRAVDETDRAEAVLALTFGLFATAGAVIGYWTGTLGVPRFTPLFGFFLGLILPGAVAGAVAAKIQGDRAEPAILLMLLFAPTGAGLGAWLGTAIGPTILVGLGLAVGSILGGAVAHLMNVAVADAVNGTDAVSRHHGDYGPWWPKIGSADAVTRTVQHFRSAAGSGQGRVRSGE